MLEKKHLVFLAGATAPFTPPLCTALRWSRTNTGKEVYKNVCVLNLQIYFMLI